MSCRSTILSTLSFGFGEQSVYRLVSHDLQFNRPRSHAVFTFRDVKIVQILKF